MFGSELRKKEKEGRKTRAESEGIESEDVCG